MRRPASAPDSVRILGFSTALTVLLLSGCSDRTPVNVDQGDLVPQFQVVPVTSSVHWLSDLSDVPHSSARLKRTRSSVSFSLRTTGLEKGHVTTLWWVIFNHPEYCANPIPEIGAACGLPDLFNADVAPSVMYAAGNMVGNSGRTGFGGSLREGEVTKYHPAFVGSPGLIDAEGAELHLVVRTHGPRIPGMIAGMLTTFEVGCTAGTSSGFGDGPNECADLQAAAFPAP